MSEKDFYVMIAEALKLRPIQVANTIELLDEGNTVPFIARYRKERTGKLDEEDIRAVEERIKYLRMLEERKKTILHSIEEQDKLTPELAKKVTNTLKLQELEDLYLPYRPRKRTRATVAREKELEPLAEMMQQQDLTKGSILELAAQFVDTKKEVNSPEEALAGARDIVAETISDDAEVRRDIRERIHRTGILISKAKDPEQQSDYEMYYDFAEQVKKIPPHRILAINRGEREKVLKVSIEIVEADMLSDIRRRHLGNPKSIFVDELQAAIADSYKRLIAPSIDREIRNMLSEKSDEHAIGIFATNLKNLLLQPPVKGKVIMGIDPGFRSGCKVAVIDETGKYLEGDTIFPHPPQSKVFQAKGLLRGMIDKYSVQIIAIGNGTASRETEALAADLLKEIKSSDPSRDLVYIIVNEAGASVYSASKIAKQEFPDLEASLRGNISIARRLMDPLAELVKIDPKHIGVGLYQHDVNQKNLDTALSKVVESAVNAVGVDLNTASSSLLSYISGLTSRTAGNIVSYRDKHGKFCSRSDLQEVAGVGEVAFEQAAGFLRITEGENILDNTGIHPESYQATHKLLKRFGAAGNHDSLRTLRERIRQEGDSIKEVAVAIGVGEPTLEDILVELEKPGRDPRDEMQAPLFKSDVLNIEDLRPGMLLKGTVRNVVDFGAFVDIGVKRDGLVHVSQMADRYVKNPLDIIAVGDVVSVKVMDVDMQRGRVKLSMKI